MKHNREITIQMKDAARFHGHLGPFLVIVVRMGEIAKKQLGLKDENRVGLNAWIRAPPYPPFSCVIDGIQVATGCTVGNQKLKIEESLKEIRPNFRLERSNRTVKILANSMVVRSLTDDMSIGVNAELLATRIARMRKGQLFLFEK